MAKEDARGYGGVRFTVKLPHTPCRTRELHYLISNCSDLSRVEECGEVDDVYLWSNNRVWMISLHKQEQQPRQQCGSCLL